MHRGLDHLRVVRDEHPSVIPAVVRDLLHRAPCFEIPRAVRVEAVFDIALSGHREGNALAGRLVLAQQRLVHLDVVQVVRHSDVCDVNHVQRRQKPFVPGRKFLSLQLSSVLVAAALNVLSDD